MVSNKKLIFTEIKRNTWVIAVIFIMMLLLKPLMLLMDFENNARWCTTAVDLIKVMEGCLIPQYNGDLITTYIAAVLLGLTGFSFVFSKSKVDLYHSIPVKRTRRFIVNYVSGLLIYTVILTVITVITAGVAASNHFLTTEAVKNIILTYAADIVHFIYSYSLVVLAVMLTGHIVVCFAAIGTLASFYYFITEQIYAYKSHFFVTNTVYREIGAPLWRSLPYFSPFTSFQMFYDKLNKFYSVTPFYGRMPAFIYLLKSFLVAVIVLISAYVLYTKRSSESAGKAVAFNISRPFIRIPVVILIGMFAGFMLINVAGRYESKWLWIGAAIGVIISHFVLEIIFNFNFKAFFNNKIQLAACLIVTFFIILIFDKDLINFDRKVPDRDNIEAAAVVFMDINNDVGFTDYTRKGNVWLSTYHNRDEWMYDRAFTEAHMIDKIYDISNICAGYVDKMKEDRIARYYGVEKAMEVSYNYVQTYEKLTVTDEAEAIGASDGPTAVYIPDTDDDLIIGGDIDNTELLSVAKQYMDDNDIIVREQEPFEKQMTLTVYYKLKDNSVMLRSYVVPYEAMEESFKKVFEAPEYKLVQYNFFEAYDNGAIYKAEAYDAMHTKQMSLTGGDADELLYIYGTELVNMKFDDLKETPIGSMSPFVKNENYDDVLSGYYIYPSFTETISYMKEKGVNMEFFTASVDPDIVSDMIVNPYGIFEYKESGEDDSDLHRGMYIDMTEINYISDNEEDMEIINSVAPHLTIMSYGYSNYLFNDYDERLDILVCINSSYGVQRNFNCRLNKDEMPKELLNNLIVKMYEYQN